MTANMSTKLTRNRLFVAGAALAVLGTTLGLSAVAQQAQPGSAPDVIVTGKSPFGVFAVSNEANRASVNYGSWTEFISKLVVNESGRSTIAYRLVREGAEEYLGALVSSLQTLRPEQLNRQEQLALWLNLNNAEAVRVTTASYPVRSGEALVNGKAWNEQSLHVSGVDFSLNELRTRILAPNFQDPRIIAALIVPAKDSPALQPTAFSGADLSRQLDDAAQQYINLKGVVNVKGDVAFVSPIYTQNRAFFGGEDAKLLAHLRQFANDKLAAKLAQVTRVEQGGFNWALNDYIPRTENYDSNVAQQRSSTPQSGYDGGGHAGS
ncbi:MAG: DUF547 domain-containing protein [Sphingomonas sp.]